MSNLEQMQKQMMNKFGRSMTEEEIIASDDVVRIAAPIGLSEWRLTDGRVFMDSAVAVRIQAGINAREGKDNE